MLETVFKAIINMSISASVAAVLIVLFRGIAGKKMPRIFIYTLWSIVLLRLVCPFFLPSMFSIYNVISMPDVIFIWNTQETQEQQYQKGNLQRHGSFGQNINSTITNTNGFEHDTYNINGTVAGEESRKQDNRELGYDVLPDVNFEDITKKATMENLENNALEENKAHSFSENTSNVPSNTFSDAVKMLISVGSWIWIVGAVSLLLFGAFLYFRTAKKLEEAVLHERIDLLDFCKEKLRLKRSVKIFNSDRIDTPFVHGLINPRIMLPSRLIIESSEQDLKYIIMHELVHIKRFDYIIKLISMLVLCIYWFNPVIWLCYILSQKDMEMSCDDKVITVFEEDIRKEYATVLVRLAEKQNSLLGSGFPAFGESNVKSRVKGIVNFKKPGIWIISVAALVLVVFILVLLTDGHLQKEQPVYKLDMISSEEYDALKKAVAHYYIKHEPDTLKMLVKLNIILEVDKYGDGYLVLAEKYNQEGQNWDFPNLLLINDEFIVEAVTSGLRSYLPYFATYSTVDGDKQIVCGRIKEEEKKISQIQIVYEDGTVVKDTVSRQGGYIVVADTVSDVKDVKLYNSTGKALDIIKESPLYKKCSFVEIEPEDEYPDNHEFESVVLNNCIAKEGPGYDFQSIGTYKYGDVVLVTALYDEWAKCKELNAEGKYSYKWIKKTNLMGLDEIERFSDNYGIVTTDRVTVGEVVAKRGNLLKILIREEDKSCVYIAYMGRNDGWLRKIGWVDNSTYSLPEPEIYYNQGILKSGASVYGEPGITSSHRLEIPSGSFVDIVQEKDEWVYYEKNHVNHGWVLRENIYIPSLYAMEGQEREAYKVVTEYFDALEKYDYERMAALSTELHKNDYIFNTKNKVTKNKSLKELGGASLKSIVACVKRQETELEFDVSVREKLYDRDLSFYFGDLGNVVGFRVILVKGEDGVWRVDRFSKDVYK